MAINIHRYIEEKGHANPELECSTQPIFDRSLSPVVDKGYLTPEVAQIDLQVLALWTG